MAGTSIRYHGFQVLLWCLVLTFLWSLHPLDAIAESKVTDKVDGYRGYRFGMTLEQADAVRPDDVVNMPCKFEKSEACLHRTTKLFGEQADIDVLISSETHTVDRINITFSRPASDKPEPGVCQRLMSNISKPLLETFGTNYRKIEETFFRQFTWHFPRGGQVEWYRFGTADTCHVVVSYAPSDGFE